MSNTIGKISDTAAETATASLRSHVLAIIARLVTSIGVLGALTSVASETTDTATVVALLRALLARWTVSSQNATANVDAADVIGNKTDAAADTADVVSLVALARKLIARGAGGVVSVFPDAAAGAALLAGAANTYGDLVSVSGALGAASRVVSLTFNTPAVAIEPTEWQLSYGAGASVVATGVVGFGTAVGTYPPINLLGTCGVIPAGSTLQVKIRSASGATTCNVHCATMPA